MSYNIGESTEKVFQNILNEAGYALTKLKGYLNYNIRWVYVGDEPCLLDNENTEPKYSVNWIGPDDEKHPNTYAVSTKDGVSFYSDTRSTYEKIDDIMRPSSVYEEVIKTEQVFDESKINLFNSLLEAIDDFPKNTRAMYRFAKRKHDDTKAIRKVSKEPYWVHPEGVAKIVMEHGGSDIEIKAAMAHDTMEDAGVDYDDMEEKFGEKVASIVKEVTNDKYEIARVGKEKYISDELCRLSPEALTVKLADMLYNMKDSPTESNYERMRKNIAFLMMNRQLDGVHLVLAEEILEV